ncbi:unnamed protein product [Brachionus calyciflorus]|uniref:Uncharacterized protein n=1 Tax=Brachionus calyciflorus TaxID=104777 RepID=A0A814Q913_9BILA|nr:unnamed protein product [Brachionus calyciflorus]
MSVLIDKFDTVTTTGVSPNELIDIYDESLNDPESRHIKTVTICAKLKFEANKVILTKWLNLDVDTAKVSVINMLNLKLAKRIVKTSEDFFFDGVDEDSDIEDELNLPVSSFPQQKKAIMKTETKFNPNLTVQPIKPFNRDRLPSSSSQLESSQTQRSMKYQILLSLKKQTRIQREKKGPSKLLNLNSSN